MNIRIKIPDKMINNQPYTIRDYKILRLHKDSVTNQATVDILDPVFNSSTNELTFKSDKFSIYVLTYKDTYYSPSYPVTGIKVSPDTLTLTKKGETAQLTAEVTPSYADNKRVTWQSSDEKVATHIIFRQESTISLDLPHHMDVSEPVWQMRSGFMRTVMAHPSVLLTVNIKQMMQ